MRWPLAFLLLAAWIAEAADVPFETTANIIHVRGSLNRQDGHVWLLDTGASITTVTPEAAAKAGWTPRRAGVSNVPSIGAGDAVVEDIRVLVGDPPGLRGLRERGVDYSGILGHSFLERFVTTLDYRKRRLVFVPVAGAPELAADGERSWIVPFRTAGRIMFVEAAINGQAPYSLVVDSGASHTLLTPEAARRLGIRGERKVVGTGEVEVTKVESLAAGGAEVRDFLVLIHDLRAARQLRLIREEFDGLLGATFLQHFVLTIDYRASRLRFTAQ